MTFCLTFSARAETLTYASYADIKDWDPAIAFSLEAILLSNVYEPLLWYNPHGSAQAFRPGLATSWSQSDDKLTWTFALREGVKFHDGTMFDASAAKTALERTIEMKKGASYIWSAVEKIETPDTYTLSITTKQPAPIDLIASAQYAAYLYSPAAAEKGTEWFNRGNASGTGPYKVVRWDRGQQVVLEANTDYWGGVPEGRLERVIIKIVRESSTQTQLIRSGSADIITLVPVDVLKALVEDSNITVRLTPSWMNSQFLFNTQRPPTDNLKFRQALAHAWDYVGVAKWIYGGTATVPHGLIPSTMWGADTGIKVPVFDLAKAKRLIDESGVPQGKRRIHASYIATSLEYSNSMLLFQAQLAKIGVNLVLRPGPWSTIWDQAKNLRTAPNIISMTWWPTYPSPSDWLVSLFGTEKQAVFNLSHYSNPEFDRLIKLGRELEATDRDEAIIAYQRAQRILIDDAPAIFYADIKSRLIHRSDLSGVESNPAYAGIRFANIRRKR